jgi:hypothetical protein
MGNFNVGSLVWQIVGDSKQFKQDLEKSGKKLKDFGAKATKAGKALTLSVTAPIVGIGAAAIKASIDAGKLADKLLDLEQITGLSTDSLQKLESVSAVAGVNFEGLTGVITKFTNRIPSFEEGTSVAAESFNKLGVNLRDANGELRSTEELFPELVKSLQNIENVTERNSLAQQVFGRSLQDLAPILGLTNEEFDKIQQNAVEAGTVLSVDALKAANDFRVELDLLKLEISKNVAAIGIDLIPLLKQTLIPILKSTLAVGKRVVEFFSNLPTGIQKTIVVIAGLAAAIGPLLLAFGGIVSSIGSIKLAIAAATPALLAIKAAFIGFLPVLGAFAASLVAVLPVLAAAAVGIAILTKEITALAKAQKEADDLVAVIDPKAAAAALKVGKLREERAKLNKSLKSDAKRYKELTIQIDKYAKLLDKAGNFAAENVKKSAPLTKSFDDIANKLTKATKVTSAASDRTKELIRASQELRKELRLQISNTDEISEKIAAVDAAFRAAAGAGLSESSQAFKSIRKEAKQLGIDLEGLGGKGNDFIVAIKRIGEAKGIAELDAQLKRIELRGVVFGDEISVIEEKQALLNNTLVDATLKYGENSDLVDQVKKKIGELGSEAQKTIEPIKELAGEVEKIEKEDVLVNTINKLNDFKNVVNDISGAFVNLQNIQIAGIERENKARLAALDSAAQKEIDALDGSEQSAEQRAAIEEDLAKQKVKINEETEKKVAELRYQADLANWAAQLVNIPINTASAIMEATKALAGIPLIGPGLATAAGLFIGGLGAAQFGAVAANKPQPPAFEDGVLDLPSDTMALLHQNETVVPKPFADDIREGNVAMMSPEMIKQLQGGTDRPLVINLVLDSVKLGQVFLNKTKNGEYLIHENGLVTG